MSQVKLVTCPLCGAKVKPGYLRAHKTSVHGETLVGHTLKKNIQKKAENDVIVVCSKCGKQIKRSKLAAHQKKVHPSKAQRLRALLGPDEATQTEFSKKGIALSGGGFGVGKGKTK